MERDRLRSVWQLIETRLQAELHPQKDHWSGQLSTSALSTATAVSALVQVRQAKCAPAETLKAVDEAIETGCLWLKDHQNSDGGFGDTDRSYSNIATSFLVLAAWEMAGFHSAEDPPGRAVWAYVEQQGTWDGLRRRYGKDKTFVVPILSNCALAGFVPWSRVPALPFEAAWLPQDWYRWARMPVVSYAVPALVAIGQARFHFQPTKNPVLRAIRRRAQQPTLQVLREMQPSSGGYLEAVPLTSFVLMNLAAIGHGNLKVCQESLRFILESRLPDGSWPIDTNLATWVTSLTVCGLKRRTGQVVLGSPTSTAVPQAPSASDSGGNAISPNQGNPSPQVSAAIVRWLLRCQHKARHPFTGANPGGWGWTDLSGAVPDADDTPCALLALAGLNFGSDAKWERLRNEVNVAAGRGLQWLVGLQNRDGGWPTFCRGWGKLPFDRSGTDLTAHALRAFSAWLPRWDEVRDQSGSGVPTSNRLKASMERGFRYLETHQQRDGSWVPLWFGNQNRELEDNPIYGTGKVLLAYAETGRISTEVAQKGKLYLESAQNVDGGWGGGARGFAKTVSRDPIELSQIEISGDSAICSTIEETAVALEALVLCGGDPAQDGSIMRGLGWLVSTIEQGNLDSPWPIGFYFAKLWYYERHYPTVFSLAAIGAAIRAFQRNETVQTELER